MTKEENNDMARKIHAANGLDAKETARVLFDFGRSDADVAKAFRDGIELSAEELCFNTDLASVEMVMEMIRQGVIRKMDTNSLFRWDEEYQIFSIGGSGSVVVADLDFPIVRVEDHACVEIASVKGRAEIRNDAIVSIGRVGGSVHVTDRASCVAKVVAGDANLWAEGTLTVGVAKNLVNRGMNPILVDSKVAGIEPEQFHAEKAIADVKKELFKLNVAVESVSKALKDAGIMPEQSRAEKAIAELQNANESLNQGIK